MKFFTLCAISTALLFKLSLTEVAAEREIDHTDHDSAEVGEEITRILDNIQQGYDKRVRPNFGGPPVTVGVTMYILSIPSVSEMDMDFTMDMYFRQTWNDPRLKFEGPSGVKTISLGPDFSKTLWLPDTFFPNEKRTYLHTATKPNEFVRISENGDIIRSIRFTVTASCPMNLQYFPMDSQTCSLEIESYASTMADIRYQWARGLQSVGIAPDVSLPRFKIIGYKQQNITFQFPSGNYSRVTCEIHFSRASGYYIIGIYIPAAIIVIISWITFWISRDAATARVALGVTTVLIMVAMSIATNALLPKVFVIKAVDIYLMSCFSMVFVTLLQSATVGYLKKHVEMRQNAQQKKLSIQKESMNENCENKEKQTLGDSSTLDKPQVVGKLYAISPCHLDKISRVLFPVIFICFNIIYWLVYKSYTDYDTDDLILMEFD